MMEDKMDQAPDLIGPVIAYRAWRVDTFGPLLCSMNSWNAWRAKEDQRAACIGPFVLGSPHNAPQPSCKCGIYVMHTLDDLLNEPTQVVGLRRVAITMGRPVVAGQVEVWGRSERYERGRRVEWCRVRALYRTPLAGTVDVDALAETYGVPVLDDPGGKIGEWRQEKPEGSGRYWHTQWPAYRQRVMTGMPAAYSHHVHAHLHAAVSATMVTMQDDADAMQKATNFLSAAAQLSTDAMRDTAETISQDPTDPDKPIPGPRKDHLQIAAKHRTRGARNV